MTQLRDESTAQKRFTEELFVSVFTLSVVTTSTFIAPVTKVGAALLGSTAAAAAGMSVRRVKAQGSDIDDLIAEIRRSLSETTESEVVDPTDQQSQQTTTQVETSTSPPLVLPPTEKIVFPPELPKEPEFVQTNQVIAWLDAQNITVRDHYQPEAADYVFERIAVSLGRKYNNIEMVYKKIKRNISLEKTFL